MNHDKLTSIGFIPSSLWFLNDSVDTQSCITTITLLNPNEYKLENVLFNVPLHISSDNLIVELKSTPLAMGTYGIIFIDNTKTIIVKYIPIINDVQPETEIIEAYIHCLVEHTLLKTNIPKSIPSFKRIITTGNVIGFVMDYCSGKKASAFLREKLCFVPPFVKPTESIILTNDSIIITFLAQIATILYILQTEIEFNHRDFYGENIIMTPVETSYTEPIKIKIDDTIIGIPLLSGCWPQIIDMGFARVKCPTAGIIGTSSMFYEDKNDPSFSQGRDICHLVMFIIIYVIGLIPNKSPSGYGSYAPISNELRNWLYEIVTLYVDEIDKGFCLVKGIDIYDQKFKKRFVFDPLFDSSHRRGWENLYHVLNINSIKLPNATPTEILKKYVVWLSDSGKFYIDVPVNS